MASSCGWKAQAAKNQLPQATHNQRETRLTEVSSEMAAGASASSAGSLNTGFGSPWAVQIERISGEEAIQVAGGLVAAVQAAETLPEMFIVPATASAADMLSWDVGAVLSARALVGERERSGWPFTSIGLLGRHQRPARVGRAL